MEDQIRDEPAAFVPVIRRDGSWTTPAGDPVAWYEVRTDLVPMAEVEAALERVLGVYGVSDVVVDAFRQFRKELPPPSTPPAQPE